MFFSILSFLCSSFRSISAGVQPRFHISDKERDSFNNFYANGKIFKKFFCVLTRENLVSNGFLCLKFSICGKILVDFSTNEGIICSVVEKKTT